MPLITLSAADALANLKRNPLARWPDGRRDGRRLDGVVLPGHRAGFHLLTSDSVLTVGSCFARNIESRLVELGFRVPARAIELPEEERGSDTANDILNKYNPYSIANEFHWAFEEPFPEEAFLELGPDRWHDPHLAANAKPVTLRRLRVRRVWVTDLFKRLPRCRCVIVTLGLVEAWYDQKVGLYLNAAPPGEAVLAEPTRFRLDVLSHDEVLGQLERMWGLIQKHGSPKVRMLLTVSPVPLRATFTTNDVLVANGYSKSTLRAAAGAFAAAHPEVDYFPSYEAATLTPRTTAFLEDNRHVAPELVSAILDHVIRTYVPSAPVPADPVEERTAGDLPVASEVRQHLRMGRPEAARRLLARVARSGDFKKQGFDEFGFRHTYAKVLAETDDPLEASVQLERCVALRPDSAVAWYALGRALMRLQRPLRAEAALARTVELDGANKEARLRLAKLQLRNGKLTDAEASAAALLAQDPDHAAGAAVLAEVRAAAAGEWGESDAARQGVRARSWSGRLRRAFGLAG